MTQFPVLNFQDFIASSGDALTTTSRHIASVFGKRHDHVLHAIRNLIADLPEEDRLPNFRETVSMRENPSGGALIPSVSFIISRDGFTLLAMQFTGKKALGFKLAYIKAFNAMAAYIKNQREGLQYQYFQKEIAYATRKKGVSASARDMRTWQDDKPAMLDDMGSLLEKMQPSLLSN